MMKALTCWLAKSARFPQGTLLIAAEKAPAGQLAAAIIRDRKTGRGFIYTVSDEWLPKIGEWIKTLDPPGRYQAVMKAEGLFQVIAAPAQ